MASGAYYDGVGFVGAGSEGMNSSRRSQGARFGRLCPQREMDEVPSSTTGGRSKMRRNTSFERKHQAREADPGLRRFLVVSDLAGFALASISVKGCTL
jgi:hypothetical protein